MGYRLEDLELDENYWQSLLSEAERQPLPVTRLANHQDTVTHRNVGASQTNFDVIWATLERALDEGTMLEVEVTGCNRGGLIVTHKGVRGFIPSSHVLSILPDCDETERRSSLAEQIGHKLNVRVIELDHTQERVVFSEKEKQDDTPREVPPILFHVRPGDVCSGTVTNLTAFGAFVDLGGYEGLVHVSELSWSRVQHPRDLLQVGQTVEVYVMSVAPEEGRIALSLKRAKQSPWEGIDQRYTIGQTVRGTVTNVVQFGAFVRVEEDLEGLVHVSELADGNFLHPRNIVKEGDFVVARVIGIDSASRRLALSLKRGTDS
jgi:small subunit ribosomal protein S1